jgi:eukaryotic-like serine/threonine-protein kinase
MDLHLRASTATWSGPRAPEGTRRAPAASSPGGGERLGVYALGRLLGEGGMARVYAAEHTVCERLVAIKRLLPELADHPEAHALFLREARITGAVRHPGVVEVYDFGYDPGGRPYYVMELVPGPTLARRLAAGPLLTSQALDLAIALADVLAAIHRAGYVHRDVKADNVLLAPGDRRLVPRLIDFGIARRLDDPSEPTIAVAGTPRVMAPEQVARDRVDERADVWGLGVLLYEMLTARLPFEAGGSLREALLAVITEPPEPLPDEVDPGVRAIVEACLAKDPDDRPADAAALAGQLRAAQAAYLAARALRPRR